jgi:hypothetical protein
MKGALLFSRQFFFVPLFLTTKTRIISFLFLFPTSKVQQRGGKGNGIIMERETALSEMRRAIPGELVQEAGPTRCTDDYLLRFLRVYGHGVIGKGNRDTIKPPYVCIFVHMCTVYMCVCMYACMYICMHVCAWLCVDSGIDGLMIPSYATTPRPEIIMWKQPQICSYKT